MEKEYKLGQLQEKANSKNTKNTFVVSSDRLDRDFEIVKVKGINTDEFKKNPSMFFLHKSNEGFPIGHWTDTRKTSENGINYLLMNPEFFQEDENALKVEKFVNAREIKMASIGFSPLQISYEEPDVDLKEIMDKIYWRDKIRIWDKSMLNEVSIVNIGSNYDSLIQKGVSDGKFTRDDYLWFKKYSFDPRTQFFFMNAKVINPEIGKSELESVSKGIINENKEIDSLLNILLKKGITINFEEKAGAVLSKANISKLETMEQSAQSIADSARGILDSASKPEPNEPDKTIKDEKLITKKILTVSELINL